MRKQFNKWMSLVLVASVAIICSLFTPTEKAEASEVCSMPGYSIELCVDNGIDVNVEINSFYNTYFYTMELQRYENGRWNVIGTRTGKLDGFRDYHTFYPVRLNNGNDKLKIYVKLFKDEKHLDYVGAVQSQYFYR